MSGIFLRWGVPGFVTVVGGTAIAIMMTGENIASDLASRASDALATAEFGWASASFEARDAVIAGTATDQRMIDAVVARVAAVHGVRSVTSGVVLAEFVSPFPFEARIEGDAIAVSGGVPDETAHAEIILRTTAASDGLRLMSGAPERAAWHAAVDYGLSHLEQFDLGQIALADLELSVTGRARSPDAFDALQELSRTGAPLGVQLTSVEIEPPLASPFEWYASYDGARVLVSGYAPTEAFARQLQAAGIGGVPVSTGLRLASGAPQGFDDTSLRLLENLVRLERGSASISDGSISLEGAPPDQQTAADVLLAMAPLGATVTLDPPRVAEYEFTAVRSAGAVTLTGYVPDAATRDRLDALDAVDATGLELARGAPERFQSGVDFVLEAMARMSDGRASIRSTVIALQGRATTIADFTALETTIALGAPQGLILARAEIKPPLADPFVWSAEKSADGSVAMGGFVPSRKAREALRAAVPGPGPDSTTLADGNPAHFEASATAALAVLQLLDTGTIAYDGRLWSLTGTVDTPQKAFAAETAFNAAGLRAAGWSYSVALPGRAAAAAIPVADPYVWRAQKSEGGSVSLSGYVINDGLRRFAAVRAGAVAQDTTEIASGEPAGFIANVLAGLDALAHLSTGTAKYEDGKWLLAGVPQTAEDGAAALAALAAGTGAGAGWETSLSAPIIAPVPPPPPEPAAEPETEAPATATPAVEPEATTATDVALAPEPAIAPEPVIRDFTFEASKAMDAPVTFSGKVPADATRRWFGVIAGEVPTDALEVGGDFPADFIPNADAGIRTLAMLSDGRLGFDGSTWVLSGRVESEVERSAALARLDVLPSTGNWEIEVTQLPPIDVCRRRVDAFSTRNAILFQSGSARMTSGSELALDELTGYLAICPEATVDVEGHTDSDGPDDLNLVLSVARAEAVVNALIARGVRSERLYAVGYGEGLPIADNATNAGKQANRRIVFTVLDEHQ